MWVVSCPDARVLPPHPTTAPSRIWVRDQNVGRTYQMHPQRLYLDVFFGCLARKPSLSVDS